MAGGARSLRTLEEAEKIRGSDIPDWIISYSTVSKYGTDESLLKTL